MNPIYTPDQASFHLRVGGSILNAIERDAVRSKSSRTEVVTQIIRAHYNKAANRDDLYAAALTSINSRLASLETRSDLTVSSIFQFVKLYLAHTPPIPPASLPAVSASAQARFDFYYGGLLDTIASQPAFIAKLMDAFISSAPGSDADGIRT